MRLFEVAAEMALYREQVNFDFVIMLGDNICGGHRPDDFRQKFEVPYHILLDAEEGKAEAPSDLP